MTQLDRNFTDGMADYFAGRAKATAEFDSQSSASNCHGPGVAKATLLVGNRAIGDPREDAIPTAWNSAAPKPFR